MRRSREYRRSRVSASSCIVARERRRVSTSTRSTIALIHARIHRHVGDVSGGDIAPRSYIRGASFAVRSMDYRSDWRSREESAGGCAHRRALDATLDACECTRSRPTYVQQQQQQQHYSDGARDERTSDVIKAIMVIITGGLRPLETNRLARERYTQSGILDREISIPERWTL